MKNSIIKLAAGVMIGMSCAAEGKSQNFKAEQFVQSASIVLLGNIDKVFPLFGAMEEKKWSEGWHPTPVFPVSGNMEEGLIFQSPDHVPNSGLLTWVVAKYDRLNHQVQYIVTSANRVTVITVACSRVDDDHTKAEITYQLTGLNEEGNEISHHLIAKIFENKLTGWETAINNYLTKTN
jgi:hypothetical protein